MIRINKHIEDLKPSATLAINNKVKYLRSKGTEICHFGFGQSPFPIHKSIVKALKDNATINHYLPTTGFEKLRQAISAFLRKHQNIESDSDYIYIGPGSKELLYQTILILDGIFLIPKGSWVSYGPQIKSKNGNYIILDTHLKHNFKLKAETLKHYCQANPYQQKTLILNSPNNPTGEVYTNDELEALAKICRDHDIIVLSDEIYSQINFTNKYSPSISRYYPKKTIVYGGLSKVFSAGGYRLGFMVLPKDLQFLHNMYRSVFSETFSAVAAPIQYAAVEAYKMNKDLINYIDQSCLILKGISHFIHSELSKSKIQCTYPEGAFYMIIGFNNFKNEINSMGISTSEQLANHLLKIYKVALLPGTDFYFDENELFLRLAFVDFDGQNVLDNYDENIPIDKVFIKTYCPKVFQGINELSKFVSVLS
jgi:aspartate/methionine/tyrosine aminotransferase